MIRSHRVLDHARNQQCQIRLYCCNESPHTVVFCHLNGAAFGKSAGMKAHDIAGFFGCSNCHSYYDTGHGTNPRMTDLELSKALLKAVVNTWVILVNDGIIIAPLDPVTPTMERPVKARKPIEQRGKIPSRGFDTGKRKFGR